MMRTKFAPRLVALLLVPILGAQQKSDPVGERVARLAALKQEFHAAQQAAIESYQKAKDDAERQRIAASMPRQSAYVPKLWPIVAEQARDEAAAQALAWIAAEASDQADREKACALLLEHHLANPVIAYTLFHEVDPTHGCRRILRSERKNQNGKP